MQRYNITIEGEGENNRLSFNKFGMNIDDVLDDVEKNLVWDYTRITISSIKDEQT